MLDNDGDGDLAHDEFLTSLYRLMTCGPFQQTCVLQMGINDLKSLVKKSHKETYRRLDMIAEHIGLGSLEPPPETENPKDCDMPASPVKDNVQKVSAGEEAAGNGRMLPIQQRTGEEAAADPKLDQASAAAISAGVPNALNSICEEVSGVLHRKARSELAVRLNDLLRSCRLEDLCQGFGRWEPTEDSVQSIQGSKAIGSKAINVQSRCGALPETGRNPPAQGKARSAAVSDTPASAQPKHQGEWAHPMAVPLPPNPDSRIESVNLDAGTNVADVDDVI